MTIRPFPFRAASPLVPILSLAAGLLVLPGAVGEAKADLRVCNSTQSLVGVSIGYRGEEGWISEGWWRIPATQCRSVIEGQLSSRYYYLYAEDAEGVGRWAGEVNLCIAENEFRVVGVEDCFSRGYQEMGFREYDTGGQASWMVQLTNAPGDEAAPPPIAPTDTDSAEPDRPAQDETPNQESSSQ